MDGKGPFGLAGDDYSEDWDPEFIYIQGYPFEVTIKVKGKKLSITVVDDPEEDGTEYELVNNLSMSNERVSRQRGPWQAGNRAGGIPSGSHFSDIIGGWESCHNAQSARRMGRSDSLEQRGK